MHGLSMQPTRVRCQDNQSPRCHIIHYTLHHRLIMMHHMMMIMMMMVTAKDEPSSSFLWVGRCDRWWRCFDALTPISLFASPQKNTLSVCQHNTIQLLCKICKVSRSTYTSYAHGEDHQEEGGGRRMGLEGGGTLQAKRALICLALYSRICRSK